MCVFVLCNRHFLFWALVVPDFTDVLVTKCTIKHKSTKSTLVQQGPIMGEPGSLDFGLLQLVPADMRLGFRQNDSEF